MSEKYLSVFKYVAASYTDQVSRIRHHLQQYRGSFLSLAYIDSTGSEIGSSYDIWINLCLITSKVRPSFIIKWTNYLDPNIYIQIMRLLVHYRDTLDSRDLDYRLLFLTDRNGIIVTTYYSYYKHAFVSDPIVPDTQNPSVRNLYAQYRSSDFDATILDSILGYPAAGDSIISSHHNGTSGGHSYSIHVIPPGVAPRSSTSLNIMTNTYMTSDARDRLNSLFLKIEATVKLYDSHTIVTVSDSQKITDPRISEEKLFVYRPRRQVEVSSTDAANHKAFIESHDRSMETWNDSFDHAFEIGYIYNR